MKTMAITDFKTHALKVLNGITENKESVIITKRGKPVAEVIPYREKKPFAGMLSSALVHEGDIISPLGEQMWDACK